MSLLDDERIRNKRDEILKKRNGIQKEIVEAIAPGFAVLPQAQIEQTKILLLKQISMQLDLIISELPDIIGGLNGAE